MAINELTNPFATFQAKNRKHNISTTESTVENSKSWSTTNNEEENSYKICSNTSFKSNIRKDSIGSQARKQKLSRNISQSDYYNGKILSTLLRSSSNNASKPKLAPKSVYRTHARAVIKPGLIKNFTTHHNKPIQSNVVKGINSKNCLKPNSSMLVLQSERKLPVQPRIVPQHSFSVLTTPYPVQ